MGYSSNNSNGILLEIKIKKMEKRVIMLLFFEFKGIIHC